MKTMRARFAKNAENPTQEVHEGSQADPTVHKRSNAKLHRQSRSSVGLDSQNASQQQVGPLNPASPAGNINRQGSMQSQSVASESGEQQYEVVMVPMGMYGFREERRPIKAKKVASIQDATKRSRFSVFGGKKKSQQGGHAANVNASQADIVASGGMNGLVADSVIALSSKATAQSKADASHNDPWQNAGSAQENRAADQSIPRMPVVGKGKQPAIANGDWDEFDQQQLREYLAVSSLLQRTESVSPVDSGIGMEDDDNNTWHSAKSRASVDPHSAGYRRVSQLDADEDGMAKVLALEAALKAEMELRQQEWEDRLRAIALQKEQELERLRIEQLDRQHALEMQRQEEARLAAEEAERNRPRECVCCGDAKPPLDFPAKPATNSCEHDSRTCTECMHSWMAAEFETKGTEDLKCPECPCKLSYDDIHTCSSAATFQSYEKMLTRNALSQLDEFAWCLSPTCDSGQLNIENESGAFMECAECGYKQCLTHKCAWHTGETCEKYEYRTSGAKARDEEKATQAMLDEVSKKCPGPTCGWRIQKTDGCDHIKCKMCKFEFCWECLASHKEIKKVGNTAHQTWCSASARRTYHAQAWDNETNMPASWA
ncbi:Putative Zinc finger, RING-type, IBR domain, Zinc finger, RING/FYVE/PHD-type, TRIAD [Septoria linicola]|uniref:RBR-type E3 ubiquitin transferase n=1 Tax=Septoria linicola TaxID=215465 RepID=A0A9Q9AY69_9PEZI|nr:putative Zinc finger, RING-type, IBR domain, Zinc finger, RING/FYVE/PHD-type, TRIAD [Septoria linicola]USW55388.1 Putative Zinc finger, RING-type, IBR domain, Zinc finger, RING/FYVE/PHD-type, TRIAD [Septoria linicola]